MSRDMSAKVDNIYFVYVHRKKSNDKVFYVGKGKGNRYKSVSGRNNYWRNTANKHGWYYDIVYNNLLEEEALELEEFMIQEIGLDNLCNRNYYNGGQSGYTHSEESKLKMKSSMKGRTAWNKGIKDEKSSIRMRGKNNPMFGKKKHHSKDALQSIREKNGILVCDLNTGVFYDSIIAMSTATNLDKRFKEFRNRVHLCNK